MMVLFKSKSLSEKAQDEQEKLRMKRIKLEQLRTESDIKMERMRSIEQRRLRA